MDVKVVDDKDDGPSNLADEVADTEFELKGLECVSCCCCWCCCWWCW